MKRSTRLLHWLMSSGADAAGRFALQIVGTVVLTRLLAPELFGLSALTMVYVGVLSASTTALFEEALSQRRIVRKAHFGGALAAVLVIAIGLCAALNAAVMMLRGATGVASDLLPLVAMCSLLLFVDGPLSIVTAVARRHRRFGDIAAGNFFGVALGTITGIVAAWHGAGVWALLAVPLTARTTNLLIMLWRCPVRLRPTADLAAVRELLPFGGLHLLGRSLETLSDALFQTVVTRLFGLDGNGYLNMANRIVEPIRGATGAIGHNIAMSFFSRVQAQPERLRVAVEQTVGQTALLLQPVFVGLALTAPTIILVIAGPAWAPAAPIAMLLALATGIGGAGNFVHSGLAATGRAGVGVASGALELVATSGLLLLLAPLGPLAIGLARLLAWPLDVVYVSLIGRRAFGLQLSAMLAANGVPLLLALTMAAPVLLLASWSSLAPGALLAAQIVAGAVTYGLAVWLFQRDKARALLASLRRR